MKPMGDQASHRPGLSHWVPAGARVEANGVEFRVEKACRLTFYSRVETLIVNGRMIRPTLEPKR